MGKEKPRARWADRYWNSAEGLRLHYRDYAGPHERPPLLCLPGVTRNAADFEGVADHVAGDWRVIAIDYRGRGLSANDPQPERYAPPFYVADILKLLDQLGIADAVFIGTSLGGLVTMLLAATDNERIAGALLNDIGPVIDRAGLDRIGAFIGQDRRFGDWAEAAAAIKDRNRAQFPEWKDRDWDRFSRRICREQQGSIGFAYDMAIAGNFHAAVNAEPVDGWPLLESLADRPVTIVRGELSDLLTAQTAEQMARRIGAELVTVPRTGHAPTLDEPESHAALDRLLARVLVRD